MRINVIPVDTLADAHLRAEFREIIMSIHYYRRSKASSNGIDKRKISPVYTLNAGHGYMWYDKFGYIQKRYEELLAEMKSRGFETQGIESKFYKEFNEHIPESIRGDYTPSKRDMIINLERILIRIESKKDSNFYKYRRENLTFNEWKEFYSEKVGV